MAIDKELDFDELKTLLTRSEVYCSKLNEFKSGRCWCDSQDQNPRLYHFFLDITCIVVFCDKCIGRSRVAEFPEEYIEFSEKEYFVVNIFEI